MALGEPELALVILHALIRQSIARYADTLQRGELPRFVNKCTKTFAQIAVNLQQPTEIIEHCRMLLELSFDGAPVFTLLLTRLLEHLCSPQASTDLQTTIEERLDESPERALYQHLERENQWSVYLTHFQNKHVRKRLLLQIISAI